MSSPQHAQHAVIYTDGGYKQQLSLGGWGLHGYTYTLSDKKSSSHPKYLITSKGYLSKDSQDNPVLVKTTFEGFGSLHGSEHSNNTAELIALEKGLEFIQYNKISNVHIKLDSQYVLDGFTKRLDHWSKTGWLTSQMKPVANQGHWKALKQLKDDLKGQTKIEFEWVKGHNGDYGNELADSLATMAMKLGLENKVEEWKSEVYKIPSTTNTSKSRLLSQPQWFFSGIENETNKDYHSVYLGFTGKRVKGGSIVNLIGKPINEARLTLLWLKNKDPVMKRIEDEVHDMAKGHFRGLMVGDLNAILKKDNYDTLLKYGTVPLIKDKQRLRLLINPTEMLCEEITPARLAYQWVDEFNFAEKILQDHVDQLNGDNRPIVSIDIKDHLFDTLQKKKSTKCIMKPEFGPGAKKLDVMLNTRIVNTQVKKTVCLQLGQDLPDRNTLAAIAHPELKVYLCLWLESDRAIRYAGIIHSQEGIGLWCGPYSNLLVL